MLSWFLARHVLYMVVCHSVWAHIPQEITYACYSGSNSNLTGPFPIPAGRGLTYALEPLVRRDGLVCWNHTVKWCFLAALLFLQGITVFWFGMIVRVAVGVVRGRPAEDTRSDDEGEGEEEEVVAEEGAEETETEAEPLEEEVGVEGIDLRGWERRNGGKRERAAAAGVGLPGSSDRKELLGRIGCEKQVD